MQRLHRSRARRETKTATIKRAGAEAVHLKGPQTDENGDSKESVCRGFAEDGTGDGKESRC